MSTQKQRRLMPLWDQAAFSTTEGVMRCKSTSWQPCILTFLMLSVFCVVISGILFWKWPHSITLWGGGMGKRKLHFSKAHKLSYRQALWQTTCRLHENSKHCMVLVWQPRPQTKTRYLVKLQTDHTPKQTQISQQIAHSSHFKRKNSCRCNSKIFSVVLIKTGKFHCVLISAYH